VSDLPNEAVEAIHAAIVAALLRKYGTGSRERVHNAEQIALVVTPAALAAALPFIREQIAQEIEAEKSSNEFRNVVLDRAARVARTGQEQETPNQ
jgi:hypothetical protein